jgi:hypothetical protein
MNPQRTSPTWRSVTCVTFLLLASAAGHAAPPQWIELDGAAGVAAGDGGETFVLERSSRRLRAVEGNGRQRWSLTLPATEASWVGTPRLAVLRLRDGTRAVCGTVVPGPQLDILGPPPTYRVAVSCHAAADGSPIAAVLTPVVDREAAPLGGLQALADGSLVVYGSAVDGVAAPRPYAVVIDPLASGDGTPIPFDLAAGRVLTANADGRVVVAGGSDAEPRFRIVERNGTIVTSRTLASGDQPLAAMLVPDGDVVLVVRGGLTANTVGWALRYGPDGTQRWRQPLAFGGLPVSIAPRGDFVWVTSTATAVGERAGKLGRVGVDSAGFRFVESTRDSALALVGAANDLRLVMVGADGPGVFVHVMDPATWSLVAGIDLPCGARQCSVELAELGPDRRLLAVVALATDGPALRRAALRLDVPAPPVPGAAAGQLALEGAWYSPLRPFQGLVLDYLPRSDTLFGIYYLGSNRETPDAGLLDWYSLQGTAGSSPAPPLVTYASRNGRFSAPPAAATSVSTSSRIGLVFDDCDNATLLVVGATQRVASLQRLTRRAAGACRAGGAPGVAGDAAARPIEGSWFDPATSGQGLSIAVDRALPPAAESLFAGWFTYDVAGTTTNNLERHWFSIQGPVPAIGGRVSAVIYQTLGSSDPAAGNNTRAVGAAELALVACDRLELSYRFDAVAEVGAFALRQGTQVLTRIGGCD